jgi:hypothetical protein
MKPTPHGITRSNRTDADAFAPRRFPVTDSAYQSVTLDGYRGGCANSCEPSFRNISSDYFKAEARNNFLAEAAFFAAMIVVSSWPMFSSIRAMSGLVRAYAGL